jgi:hypothetical protein
MKREAKSSAKAGSLVSSARQQVHAQPTLRIVCHDNETCVIWYVHSLTVACPPQEFRSANAALAERLAEERIEHERVLLSNNVMCHENSSNEQRIHLFRPCSVPRITTCRTLQKPTQPSGSYMLRFLRPGVNWYAFRCITCKYMEAIRTQ